MYSNACERNKIDIAKQLINVLSLECNVLEIGSGSGQHAAYFTQLMPHVVWQMSDVIKNIPHLTELAKNLNIKNLPLPLMINVNDELAHYNKFNYVFTSNTLHIMSYATVKQCLKFAGKSLVDKGKLIIYGPFKFNNQFTSDSNEKFDYQLKATSSTQGIKDFEFVQEWASKHKLIFNKIIEMPAHNVMLIFIKEATSL